MRRTYILVMAMFLAVFAVGFGGAAQSAVEAPAGFDTPTLAQNPGSQSTSNGIAQPPGDDYALDQTRFEQDHDASTDWARSSTPGPVQSVIRIP
jgi:hypothetical protein